MERERVVETSVRETQGLEPMERRLELMESRLELMDSRFERIESRLQRLDSPPPPTPDQRKRQEARRQLIFQVTAEDPPLSPERAVPQSPVEENIQFRGLSAEREEEIFRLCHHGGQLRPDVYAANVFMAFTPFHIYKRWGKSVNWSGSNGKSQLPPNLKEHIHQQVCQRFPRMSGDQWQKVRNRINERLRSPRKVDPESQRPGYGP
ncbi:hypothetical protein D5F01_LYC16162 [Scomber scombrus]|uniref:BEN domain-containing protein n=1 Tax=Scomber scombrus TaxID=13677 RepID=A0AAV1Q2E9_SCOSC